jgi:type II secretory pathway component PulM
MRYTPNTDGGLALWLTEADFTVVLRWLDQLVQQYAVRIDHLVITPSTQSGTAEVQVVLKQ